MELHVIFGTDQDDIVNTTVTVPTQDFASSVDDIIYGLGGDDALSGDRGADTLDGGAGSDTLDGGAGDDLMLGGAGDDVYVVNSSGDVVEDVPDDGVDTVLSAVDFALGADLDNLTLTGLRGASGTGNSLHNVLLGNAGFNTLDGRAGADTMSGGEGRDSYVVDDLGDLVIETEHNVRDRFRRSRPRRRCRPTG
jgi:Ca2+-binding RTX toxin-like protein